MAARRRTGRRLFKAFLPITLLLAIVACGIIGWIVYGITRPPRHAYLVTPEKFKLISDRGIKVTEETWMNRDGTKARGWLLRGAENAPAVILLHRYGTDRSTLLNLGVKLNETSNFTVLWPDLRGHGENPLVQWTSFGAKESDDTLAALDYLRALKTAQERPLVGGSSAGLYGVELGAYAALLAAGKDTGVRALVLDSIPRNSDELVSETANGHISAINALINPLARLGTRLYLLGSYDNQAACDVAKRTGDRRVLLLSGADAGVRLRDSTTALAQCFPAQSSIEVSTDLPLTGVNLTSANGQQGEAYDRRVIDFFDKTLRTVNPQ